MLQYIMRYKRILTAGIIIFFCATFNLYAQVLLPSPLSGDNSRSLNGSWKFKYFEGQETGNDSLFYRTSFDVSKWANITVPGHWELQGFAEPQYQQRLISATGLYRRDFTVPAGWNGKPIYVAFDGVQFGYDFWVNGRYAGKFSSSYNLHVFDVSRFVKVGANTIAVRVSTRPKGWEFDTNDDWSISGIVRNVTLFSLENTHFKNVTIQTSVTGGDAQMQIKTVIETMGTKYSRSGLGVQAKLIAPNGTVVKSFNLKTDSQTSDSTIYSLAVPLHQPKLWTTETPNLYKLQFALINNKGLVLQQYQQLIGIRQVDWNDGIFKINNQAVKLRGIDHHDLSPIDGRAITEEELKKDVRLIKEANINFIRTSHYPPNRRLLEICDSMGVYVMVEVPFGRGDEHLTDSTYQPLLLHRAEATVWRDKNHPCVIIWSVGNENPNTKLTLRTAQYVKKLDSTRPVCFPQTQGAFEELVKKYPDSADVYSVHYPTVQRIKGYANRFKKPMIFTEYAHALGLDFDLLDSLTDVIWKSPKLAGGAIWCLFDQGLLRKSPTKIGKYDYTLNAWPDSVTYYDTHGVDGTDGIVYANRVPQVDYFEVRKVYSPVQALGDTLKFAPGNQTIEVRLVNRFDFTDLSAMKCKWELLANNVVISSGWPTLKCLPHDTCEIQISYKLPESNAGTFYALKLSFTDRNNYQFYEKSYTIQQRRFTGDDIAPGSASATAIKGHSVKAANYSLDVSDITGDVTLKNGNNALLFASGPYGRVGRKKTMSSAANEKRLTKGALWTPYLMKGSSIKSLTSSANGFTLSYDYLPDSAKNRCLQGSVAYDFSRPGAITIEYDLIPHGAGKAPEAGISFQLPPELSEFRWIGRGPYAAYPGKSKLDEFGFYHLNANDLYFPGNRQDVELAVFSDGKGNGFVLIANRSDVAVERSAQGVVLSLNAIVSGRFNKFGLPEKLYDLQEIKKIAGKFTIIPFQGKWPATINQYFGTTDSKIKPFQPFFNSYDQ